VDQVVEHPPSKCKALSSNLNNIKNRMLELCQSPCVPPETKPKVPHGLNSNETSKWETNNLS
jgi:hypothetical protein